MLKDIYVMGVYTEVYINGVEYLVYDIKLSESGVELNNIGDVGKVLQGEVKNSVPNIIELAYKEVGYDTATPFNQLDFGKTILLYNTESTDKNIFYIPYVIKEDELIVRYVLKDKSGVLAFNVLKNKNGQLSTFEVTDDDMISLAGLGIDKYVKTVQELMNEVRGI